MERARGAVYATVAVIVGLTLVSGPAVGLVDLTSPRYDTGGLGQGNATVAEVDAPERAQLDRGYQSDSYYLKAPDARLRFSSIAGKPTVSYSLEIQDLSYTRSTTTFLQPDDEGWVQLSMEQATFEGDRITGQEYRGNLSIVLRANGNETVIHRAEIPVEVTE